MDGRLIKAYDRLLDAMAAIGAAALTLMALWITYEVVMRYFLNAPTIWAVDLSEYALLYGTFLAAPWLVREGGHVQIDSVLSRFTPRQRDFLAIFTSLVAAAVCAVMLWQTLDATLDAYTRKQLVARSWQVPRAVVWGIMPIGSFFLTIEFIRAAVRSARAFAGQLVAAGHAADERMI